MRWELLLLGALLWVPAVLRAQTPGTLPVQPIRMDSLMDSARAEIPASHRTAATKVDEPVRVKHCPPPPFANVPAIHGYPARVEFAFVVDTLSAATGRPA